MLKGSLLKEMRQRWFQPLMKWYREEMTYKYIEDLSSWNDYILLILNKGVLYYKKGWNMKHRQVSSAQTNWTQVLTWEKHNRTTFALVDLGAFFLVGVISLEIRFSGSPRSLKSEFRVKCYGVFHEMTHDVFQSYISAAHFVAVQIITASFRALTSFYEVDICTHLTPPGEATGTGYYKPTTSLIMWAL